MKKYLLKFRNYGNDYTLGFGKELFLNLIIFCCLVSFCSSENVSNLLDIIEDDTQTLTQGFNTIYTVSSSDDYGVYCLNIYEMISNWTYVQFLMNDGPYLFDGNHINIWSDQIPGTVCIRVNQPYLYLYNPNDYNIDVSYKIYRLDVLLATEIPVLSSLECQNKYDLIPSSDLDSCQSNLSGCMTNLDNYSSSLNICSSNLNNCNTSLSSCMSSICPVSSGNVSWSSLFINNIQHLGAPIIDITIPEEFDWDYVSTDEEFTLDIEGYNVDTEYMDGIITTQTTLPNEIDFNNLISSVIPLFIPGLVVILFLYFIFKFIKKIF